MVALGRSYLLATIAFLYLPIAVMVAMAFNASALYALPIEPSLSWFAVLADNGPLLAATRNSLVIACATTIIATTLGTLAALALNRRQFRGRSLLRLLLLPPIAIPWLITGTAMLVFFFWTGIGRGIHAMMIGHVALAIPYVVLIVGTGLQTLRADFEEAAMSLGSTPVHAFFSITLPLLLSSIVAAALFAFAVSLDQFVVSYFLSTPGVSTLPVEIYASIRKGFTPEINAISTIFLGVSTALVLVFVQLSNLGESLVGVEAASVSKEYGPVRVLDRVSASFRPGLLTSLLGPSGSGKTTLLRIIGGFIAPGEGEIRFDGENVTGVPVWRRNVGMVFQSYALFPHMTVHDNIVFGLNRRGVRGDAARKEVAHVLEMVRLTGLELRKPKELSGGQQQRVALARAMVTKPCVLLLDEPLSALDRRLRQEMQVELRRIQRESGLTTILVTHDQEEALTLSDSVAILDRGRIVQEGQPAEIYERPRTQFAASFLGDANFFTGRVTEDGITIAGGLLRTSDKLPAVGTTATVAVRPEKVRIGPSQAPCIHENSLQATVTEIVYAGAVSTYMLAGADGTPIKLQLQNRDAITASPGESVTLRWSPGHTVVIHD